MIHQITIRDLNTFGNQLPKNSPVRKDIHKSVLEAIESKIKYLFLDDEDEVDIHLLKAIAAAKILEKKTKRTITNPTPDMANYMSVQEYILSGGGL